MQQNNNNNNNEAGKDLEENRKECGKSVYLMTDGGVNRVVTDEDEQMDPPPLLDEAGISQAASKTLHGQAKLDFAKFLF